MRGPAAPAETPAATCSTALDASGVLVDHEPDGGGQPLLSSSSSSSAADRTSPLLCKGIGSASTSTSGGNGGGPFGAPSSAGSSNSDSADAEQAFSDVSSLRSYELEGGSEADDNDPHGGRPSSAWLAIGSSATNSNSTDSSSAGRLPSQMASGTDGDGDGDGAASWSSHSSEDGSISVSVSSVSGTASFSSSACGQPLRLHESESESESGSDDELTKAALEGVDDEVDSLGGSYADLEPSLYSDPTLSSSRHSRALSAYVPPSSLLSSPAAATARVELEGLACELDFPDPANVSSSFTSSMACPGPGRRSTSANEHAHVEQEQQGFRPVGGGGKRKKHDRQLGLSSSSSSSGTQPGFPARISGQPGNDVAAAAGLLSFAQSGHNSFISDATWGSFDTPTASGLLGPSATTRSAAPIKEASDEKTSKVASDTVEARVLDRLPKRIRIILLGPRPTSSSRARLVRSLIRLLGELLDPDTAAAADTRIALAENQALDGQTSRPVVWDVRDQREVEAGETARSSVKIDDLTSIGIPTTLTDEETDLDRYVRSLTTLRPSSILIVHLVDNAGGSTGSSVSASSATASSIALGLLRFTLASSTEHHTRVLSVDLSAIGATSAVDVNPAAKLGLPKMLTLDALDELRGVREAVAVWGSIIHEGEAAKRPMPTSSKAFKLDNGHKLLLLWVFAYAVMIWPFLTTASSMLGGGRPTTKAASEPLSVSNAHPVSPITVEILSSTTTACPLAAVRPIDDREEPLTAAVLTASPPAETVVALAVISTSEPPSVPPSATGCEAKQAGFPRFPGGGRCCSQVSTSTAQRATTTTTAWADVVRHKPTPPLDDQTMETDPAPSAQQEPDATGVVVPSIVGTLDVVRPARDFVSAVANGAAETVSAYAALVTVDNAQALLRALSAATAFTYEVVIEPLLLRALERARDMRRRTERVWQRVDDELWLAQRGVDTLGRKLHSLFLPNPVKQAPTVRKPANGPPSAARHKPMASTLLHESREAVHVALSELRRSGSVVGRHVVEGGRVKGAGTLRDARRGLERLVAKSGELQREMLAKAEVWKTQTTAAAEAAAKEAEEYCCEHNSGRSE